MTPPMPTPRHVEPLQAIAGFAALLREHGLQVGVAEQQCFVRAALALPVQRSAQVGAAWRAIACHDARSWRLWPELFERYWMPHRSTGRVRVSAQTRPARDIRQVVQQLQQSLSDSGATPPQGRQALDTALHASHDADGGDPSDARRWQDHPRGARLDLRRTLRASLKTGGVPMAPAWRRPRRDTPRVFILVDVSRSMETHAQLFLRLARGFVQAVHARVFVFHTRLAEVTPLLAHDSATVQEKINAVTAGFGGGTRIATSLADFHSVHARAQLNRSAQVWVLSDGFDADAPHRLAEELAAVRRRGARITWFHPAAQRPTSTAVQAALPMVSRFVRLNSLRDLAQAADLLQ